MESFLTDAKIVIKTEIDNDGRDVSTMDSPILGEAVSTTDTFEETLFIPNLSGRSRLEELKTAPITLKLGNEAKEKNKKSITETFLEERRRRKIKSGPFSLAGSDATTDNDNMSPALFGRMATNLLCRHCVRVSKGVCRRHAPKSSPTLKSSVIRRKEAAVAGRDGQFPTSVKTLPFCTYCRKSFLCVKHLNLHLKNTNCIAKSDITNSRTGQFLCDVCPRNFSTKKMLDAHLEVAHQRKRVTYSAEFSFPNALDSQRLKMHDRPRVTCDKCKCEFWDELQFFDHQSQCSEGKHNAQLEVHLKEEVIHEDEQVIETASDSDLDDEQKKEVTDSPTASAKFKNEVKYSTCKHCRCRINRETLRKHQKNCSKNTSDPIEIQKQPVSKTEILSSSRSLYETSTFEKGVLKHSTECPTCYMKFVSTISLKNHIRFFHKSASSISSSSTAVHLQLDSGPSSYSFKCHICNEKFAKSEHLRNHLPIAHSGDQVEKKCEILQEIKME